MNNLAAAFAQHPVQPLTQHPAEKNSGILAAQTLQQSQPTTRKELLETAQRWAQNAYNHAADTKGAARSAECDEACIVSLCNLGDIASSLGDFGEARRRFQEARDLSQTLGFNDGLSHAEAGLRRLSQENAG